MWTFAVAMQGQAIGSLNCQPFHQQILTFPSVPYYSICVQGLLHPRGDMKKALTCDPKGGSL